MGGSVPWSGDNYDAFHLETFIDTESKLNQSGIPLSYRRNDPKMSLQDHLKFIQGVSRLESEMPLQQLHCLLVIAQSEDGLSLTDLAKKVGIGLATASRYVAALGKQNRHREEGLLLVEAFEDPMERRKKIIRLTKKGKIAIEKLAGDLNADLPKRKGVDGECREPIK